MEKKKIIVRVDASFEQGSSLFAWLKKYAAHYDDRYIYQDEFAFTTEPLDECDALLIFNNPSVKINTLCYPENVIAFMMEPGDHYEHPWMYKGLDQYAAIYSPVQSADNVILSHGYLGWYLQQNFAALSSLQVPEKKSVISCISSNLSLLKGHRLRLNFIKTLQAQIPQIDFFGRGNNFIDDKLNALLPYRYSIAIENTSAPYYFTDKINDCFLAYTVPLYYGCKNMGRYFPAKSFIQINIEDPKKAIHQIRQVMDNDDWQQRAAAVVEARELVLHKFQPLAGAVELLKQCKPSVKKTVQLKPVPGSWIRKVKNIMSPLNK